MKYVKVLEKDKELATKLHAYIVGKQIEIRNLFFELEQPSMVADMRTIELIMERINDELDELQKALDDFEELHKEYVRVSFRFFPVEKVSSWR